MDKNNRRSDGDRGYSVQQTPDNGYVIAGYTNIGAGIYHDAWLIKTDSGGDTMWTKTFGGSYEDRCYSVQPTSDGRYILAGFTRYFGSGTKYVWLIKTDAYGDTLWTKTYGGSGWDEGKSVQQTTDGGYIITGITWSYASFSSDIWLIKVDADPMAINENPREFINNYQLYPNYPNPFNPTITINYQSVVGSKVKLTIYNLLGQQIRTLVNAYQPAGAHQVQWDGRDESGAHVPSGIYFYKLEAGIDFTETKKMVLMR